MFHLFHGYIRYEDDAVYIDNGLMGIEVLYHGTQKEGTYFLFPQGDQAQHTRRYYAFDTYQQKQRFKSLLKIQGVGGKSAFHIVQCAPQQIEEALETLDIGFFQRIP